MKSTVKHVNLSTLLQDVRNACQHVFSCMHACVDRMHDKTIDGIFTFCLGPVQVLSFCPFPLQVGTTFYYYY